MKLDKESRKVKNYCMLILLFGGLIAGIFELHGLSIMCGLIIAAGILEDSIDEI